MTVPDDFTWRLVTDLQAVLKWRPIIEGILLKNKVLYDFNDLVQMMLRGERIFLYETDGFCVLQVLNWSKGVQIHVCLIGGNKSAMISLMERLDQFATDVKAKQITGLARGGFERWNTKFKVTKLKWYMQEIENV